MRTTENTLPRLSVTASRLSRLSRSYQVKGGAVPSEASEEGWRNSSAMPLEDDPPFDDEPASGEEAADELTKGEEGFGEGYDGVSPPGEDWAFNHYDRAAAAKLEQHGMSASVDSHAADGSRRPSGGSGDSLGLRDRSTILRSSLQPPASDRPQRRLAVDLLEQPALHDDLVREADATRRRKESTGLSDEIIMEGWLLKEAGSAAKGQYSISVLLKAALPRRRYVVLFETRLCYFAELTIKLHLPVSL